jgi:hypothetical protein
MTSGTATVSVSVRDLAGNTTRQDVRFTVQAPEPPPPPVDCVLSEPEWSEWSVCADNQQWRTGTRTILTAPANGGTACGPVTEIETQACVVPPPPDTTAPVVTVSAVRSGKSTNYVLSMTATDDVAVVSSFLMFDGQMVPNGATVKLGPGTYRLFGSARDAAGNIGTATLLVTR